MEKSCTIQLYANQRWQDVGSVTLFGPEQDGWRARSYTGYAIDWAVEHPGRRDAHALSCNFAVGLAPLEQPHWPVFLIDLLPQGFGREELSRRLALPPSAEAAADWPLLQAGAGNPIGNLRVKEAASWLAHHSGAMCGFSDAEVAERSDDFAEYLASHGLFVAGSSGVQGEWPKILLTRAHDGLLYLDHTLPDHLASEHFIVKFGRGTDRALAQILQQEAPYMELAKRLGLRVHASLDLKQRALFVPRFDRVVEADRVNRLAQESIATLTGSAGFGAAPSHDAVCRQLLARCTEPEQELLEYLRRDIANIALGNKDNHARNTALQRNFDGKIRLTPLFDFAPMYLHPDGIARRIRWEHNDGGQPDWQSVVATLCAGDFDMPSKPRASKKSLAIRREFLLDGLKQMIRPLREIAEAGSATSIDADILTHLRPGILTQIAKLVALH